jgi:hypothetical protein
VVEVVYQSAFHLEMNQNNVFFIFDSTSRRSKITKKINLKQKKKSKARLGLIETIFLK